MNRTGSKARRSRKAHVNNLDRNKSTLRVNHNLSSLKKQRSLSRKLAKAEYLASLPKNRWKRLGIRLRPKHVIAYWFSKSGMIMGLRLIGLSIVFSFFIVIGIFAYFRKDLPQLTNISGQNLGGSVSYYDSTGKVLLWEDYNAVQRIPVNSNQLSPYLKEATVAIEDKNFYTEGAFDLKSIFRAGYYDLLKHGQGLQGASTITEQVVKLNEGWPSPLSLSDKIKELIIGTELSRQFSKDQILTGYLNMAPYGGIEYGAQAAAQDYFHTTAANLSLAQAVMLAALPQAPSYYSPYGSTEFNSEAGNTFSKSALIGRMDYILYLMHQQHYITATQMNQAKSVNILSQVYPLPGKYTNIVAPYFVMVAKQQLDNMFGMDAVNRGGWKVTTTLNLNLQKLAQADIEANIPRINNAGADEEAIVAEDVHTGQVVALVGGTNFNNPNFGQINYANINISPGSSIKPFNYVTFINNHTNVGAGSVLYDVQEPLPGYPCTNKALPLAGGNCAEDYDFRYPGAETIRYALAGSRNVPALKAVMSEIPGDTSPDHVKSVQKFVDTVDAATGNPDAYKCFIEGVNVETAPSSDQSQCYASSGIGDGAYIAIDNQVNGDTTLARLGNELPQSYILNITNNEGKTIYQWKQPHGNQVVRKDAAYIIDNILSDPKATYLPGYCSTYTCTPLSNGGYKWQRYDGWDNAVKTGTTNYNFEGLMTGWNTQFAVVSWVGYHNRNKQLAEGQMEYITEPLTRTFMQQALSSLNSKPINWTQPSDIKVLPAYVQRTHVGLGSVEPGPTKDLFPSWYEGNAATTTNEQILDKVSGGLATSCTPADAKESVYGANANNFSVDIFWPLNQKTPTNENNYDTVHLCSDQPPQVVLTAPSQCININNQGCPISITATQGTHPLGGGPFGGTISLLINNVLTKVFPISSSPTIVNYVYYPTSSGTITLTATVTDSVLYQNSQTVNMQTIDSSGNQSN